MSRLFQPEKPVIVDRIAELTQHFGDYVDAFDKNPPFSPIQLQSHRETLALRSGFATAREAARDPQFALALRNTLIKWDMGKRKSRLVKPEDFVAALVHVSAYLSGLEAWRIDQTVPSEAEVSAHVWGIMERLEIVENKNRIVACTKALHHLLPDLVPPMDREHTQTFFAWANPEFQYHPKECFRFAFETFARLVRAVNPSAYVGTGWRTSMTKVLDNAVIGFCRSHGLQSSSRKYQRTQRERDKALRKKAKELGLFEWFKSSGSGKGK